MSSEKSILGKAAFFLKLDLIAALRPHIFDIVLTLWLKLLFDILVFDDVHRSHAAVVVPSVLLRVRQTFLTVWAS